MGYSECWETYDDIDQSIFHYNIVEDTMPSDKGGFAYMDCSAIKEIRAVNIPDYVKAFNNPRNDTGELRPDISDKKFIEKQILMIANF